MTVPARPRPIDDWNRLLDGRVAVVTGGGGGIGGAVSRLFAEHGAAVEIAEADPRRAASIQRVIEESSAVARTHLVDVTDDAAVQRFATSVLARTGRVDVLVNNVGDHRPRVAFTESGPVSWDAMYRLNLHHVLAVTRAFLPGMIERRSGAIVNIHSVEAMRGFPVDPVYAAMKAAVAQFTAGLAVAYGRFGVRVNGIGPDHTDTPQVALDERMRGHEHLWPSWTPVGRMGRPEDQARVALFLASDVAGYVTGHNIPVDGGSLTAGGWHFSPKQDRHVNRPLDL